MKVADLFVDLHLDTSTFKRELTTALAGAGHDVTVNVKTDTSQASKAIKSLDKNINSATSGLNKYTGRLAAVGDALLALTPAAVAVGAVAVPAVAGLALGLVDAGAAAVTAKVAFIGVGTALSAVSKAQLQPTTANLTAMSQALDALSPSARKFTIFLSGFSSEINKLKQSAGEGLFPGLEKGLTAASSRLPQLNALLKQFGTILGNIGREFGEAFASKRYDSLFKTLKSTAKPVLEDVFHSVENLIHGVLELVSAFAPLSKDGFSWMRDVTKNFDDWATGVKKTQGFRDFVAYVKKSGPEVVEAVAAIAKAIIAIATAAAPLSGPILAGITLFANVLAKIADSKIGTALVAGALAVRTFARATQILAPATKGATASISALKFAVLDFRTTSAATGGIMGAFGRSLKSIGPAAKAAAGPAGILAIADSATRTQGPLRSLEAAAGGAALGFSVGGPWGAAIGGGLGLLTSFIGGTKKAIISLDDLTQTLNTNSGALTDQSNAVIASALGEAGVAENAKTLGINLDTVTNAAIKGGPALDSLNASLDAQIKAGTQIVNSGRSVSVVYDDRAKAAKALKDAIDGSNSTINEALSKGRIQASVNKSVAKTTQDLASGEITAAQAARQQATAEQAATAALNAKHQATLSNFNATTAYGQALADARAQAAKGTKGLDENTVAGRANRNALSGLAAAWDAQTQKMKNVPGAAAKARASFIRVATAMGVPLERAKELAKRLLDVGKIHAKPKVSIDTRAANAKIKGTTDLIAHMGRPGNAANNIELSANNTQANSKIADTSKKADEVGKKKPTPTLDLNIGPFTTKMSAANAALAAFSKKTSTATITTNVVTNYRQTGRPPGARAAGGYISGPGSGTSDSIPARLSNGEFVMRAAAVAKYGVGTMSRMNAMRFAGGGAVGDRKRKIFGEATIRDLANGVKAAIDGSELYKQLKPLIKKNLHGATERRFLDRLDRLHDIAQKQIDNAKALDAARNKLQTLRENKKSFASDFASTNSANILAFANTSGGILGGLQGQLGAFKKFAANLQALRKLYPAELVQQVAAAGLEAGLPASEALLTAAKNGQAGSISSTFKKINTLAGDQGKILSDQFFNAGIKVAEGTLAGFKEQKEKINDRLRNMGKMIAHGLFEELNLKVHKGKGKGKATHDQGGWLDVGRTLTVNNTGKPEAVLNPQQWANMERLVSALEAQNRQGGGHGGSAPLIGHAVIRETVDLEMYERQRAFRDRMTNVRG